MSEVQPQPGDKVREGDKINVSATFEVQAVNNREPVLLVRTPWGGWINLNYWDVEILERADDPIGTIRGDRYACLEPGKMYGWWDFRMSEWALAAEARKEPVTGAVPGTPAAEAQSAKTDV